MAKLNTTNINGTLTINNIPILDIFYPIGSVYISVNSTNPGTIMGGTWVSWGSGRVPVGINTSDEAFAKAESTGGAKTADLSHTHTGPSHTHTSAAHTHTTAGHTLTVSEIPSHSHTINTNADFTVANGQGSGASGIPSEKSGWGSYGNADWYYISAASTGGGGSHSHGNTGSTTPGKTGAAGTGTTGSALSNNQNILQPYIVCYMWKRTA